MGVRQKRNEQRLLKLGIRVEVYGEPALAGPISMNHVHFYPHDVPAIKACAIDHIGFDVENLDAFVRSLEMRGIALDGPVQQVPRTTLETAFLTDPWGTRIELTEGLAPR